MTPDRSRLIDRRALVVAVQRAAESAYLAPTPADAFDDMCAIVDALELLGVEVPSVGQPHRGMAGSLHAEASMLADGRSVVAWQSVALALAHVLAEIECDCADIAA